MKKYLIALGSNLESQNLSRLEIINKAIGYFSQLNIILIKVSSFWESRSYPDKSQPDFINAVSEVHSELNPYQILHALKNIEKTGSKQYFINCDFSSFQFTRLKQGCRLDEWTSARVDQWTSGPMEYWSTNPLVPWSTGPLVHWFTRPLVH